MPKAPSTIQVKAKVGKIMSITQRFMGKRPRSTVDVFEEGSVKKSLPKKEKNVSTPVFTSSLEELQASSPSRPSSSDGLKDSRLTSKRGSGPSSSKDTSSKTAKPFHGVFGGTINKYTPKPSPRHAPKPAPVRTSTLSKSKVNPPRPPTLKSSGLEAVKQSLRKPQTTAAQFQYEQEFLEPVGPVLSKEEQEEKDEADAMRERFFENLKTRPQDEPLELVQIEIPSPRAEEEEQETGVWKQLAAEYQAENGEEELTEEEQEYLLKFCDSNTLCPLCDKPLPIKHPKIHKQAAKLLTRIHQRGRDSIGWETRTDFCNAHKHAAITIPLGERAGYPTSIDWLNIWKEVETPWIRKRIEEMVEDPLSSAIFRYFHSDDQDEEPEWAKWFANAKAIDRVSAGYFGDLGATMIRSYILELEEWGYLPLFDHETRYKPLGPNQFVTEVLVSEIALMLIHSETNSGSMDEEAYTRAQETRKRSTVYGRVAYFGLHSDFAGDVLSGNSRAKRARKEEVNGMRGRRKAKAAIVDLTVDESQEDGTKEDSPGPSRLSDTEAVHHNEFEDSDSDTLDISLKSHHSLPSPSIPQIADVPVVNSPFRLVSPASESNSPTPRDTSRRRKTVHPGSIASTLFNSRSLPQPEATPPTPGRGRHRKRKRAERLGPESQTSASASQDSFDDFPIPSQEYDRLDALVAAQ